MPVEKRQIYFCSRTRLYPDGYRETLVADRPIFCPPGWEPSKDVYHSPIKRTKTDEPDSPIKRTKADEPNGDIDSTERCILSVARARRRAAAKVRHLFHCADMRYFVTLTLSQEKIDRYDEKAIIRKMSQWCDNRVRKNGLCYILVPERHKDGAIHFHGFFNQALKVVDSGTISLEGQKKPRKPRSERQRQAMLASGGHIVYNLPSWTLGFTTAIELYGDRQQAANYVCKYITKQADDGGKIGGRWYYHGGSFAEPVTQYGDICTQDIVYEGQKDYYIFDIPEAGLSMAKKEWWENGRR